MRSFLREHSNKEAHEILRVRIKCFVKKTYDQSLGRLGIRYEKTIGRPILVPVDPIVLVKKDLWSDFKSTVPDMKRVMVDL